MTKKELRTELRRVRGRLDATTKQKYDQAILRHLSEHPVYQEAQRVMIYLSFGSEINTWPIVDHMLHIGKEVYVPVVASTQRKLLPTYYDHDTLLKSSSFGIKEPTGGVIASPEILDVVIVPGLAFSPNGYRLGYGGGYYDRFLLQTSAVRIGMCYHQFIQDIPIDNWDQPVSILITEQGVRESRSVQENLSS